MIGWSPQKLFEIFTQSFHLLDCFSFLYLTFLSKCPLVFPFSSPPIPPFSPFSFLHSYSPHFPAFSISSSPPISTLISTYFPFNFPLIFLCFPCLSPNYPPKAPYECPNWDPTWNCRCWICKSSGASQGMTPVICCFHLKVLLRSSYLSPQVVPILRAGLAISEQFSLIFPSTETFHLGKIGGKLGFGSTFFFFVTNFALFLFLKLT